MSQERIESAEVPAQETTNVIQVGAQTVKDATGTFHRESMGVTAISQGGKNGDFSETLGSDRLSKMIDEAVHTSDTVTLDLSQTAELSAEDMKVLTDRRDKLRQKGVSLRLTNATAEMKEQMRKDGLITNGLEVVTKTSMSQKTADDFAQAA